MKNIVTILILPIILLCTSCDWFSDWGKNDKKEKTELEKLPPATQTGEFTFGCLVNGKAFVVPDSYSMTAIYQRGLLQLSGGVDNDERDIYIDIVLEDPLIQEVEYDLTNFPIYRSRFRNYKIFDVCQFSYEDTYRGKIIFTKIDRKNFILSGIFEFSTVTDGCDTIRITDGRFDVQYIP